MTMGKPFLKFNCTWYYSLLIESVFVCRSGSSANLEMALQVARKEFKPINKVLFAFWGAEELGVLGSNHFVKEMAEEGEVKNIALNLNFDMIVSHTHTHTHTRNIVFHIHK